MPSKKVAILIPNFEGGGAEKAMTKLVNGFAKQGKPIDLLVFEAKGPYVDLLSKKARCVELFSDFFVYKTILKPQILKPLKYVICLFSLVHYLKKDKIDILITTLHIPNILGLIVKKFFIKKLKLVVRLANFLPLELSEPKSVTKKIGAYITKSMLPAADAIVVNSQDSLSEMRVVSPTISDRIHCLYNPVVSSYIKKQALQPVSHPWLLDEKNHSVLVSVNRLAEQKDISTQLRSLSEILKTKPSAKLIVLGEGPQKTNLEDLSVQLNIKDAVDFVGFKINPYPWIKKANVLVFTSLYEGCPNVLIEAMACGTPVVSTDCKNGPREILQEGKLGKLVPIKDYKKLSLAIIDTLDNPPSSKALIEGAAPFAIDSSVKTYEDFLETYVHD